MKGRHPNSTAEGTLPKRRDLMQLVSTDPRFDRQFGGRLMQIFLYVTDECNLRCTQCYYKPWLRKGHAEMPTPVAVALLQKFRDLGAIKVSFLGGEPTLYGQAAGNEPLGYLVHAARQMGFEYIRAVTNGTFDNALLNDDRLKKLDEITFSIDGDTPAIHNKLRGGGSYERSVAALRAAINAGYPVHITMCVHRGNVGRSEGGVPILSRAIKWAGNMGVKSVNLHPLFRMGVARDHWTGETNIEPRQWMSLYDELQSSIKRGEYDIPVRMPMRFVNTNGSSMESECYKYCSVKLKDRLDVHPNGQMHICALHSGTPISVASFDTSDGGLRIKWTASGNELDRHPSFNDGEGCGCPIMRGFPEKLRPLCVSFKPGQDEFVWRRLGLA